MDVKMKAAVGGGHRCSSCGCKFFGKSAVIHVPGDENCLEWYRDRMEQQHERARD